MPPKKKSGVQWEWQDDSGSFLPLDATVGKKVEAAHQAGEEVVKLKSRGFTYEYNLQKLTQVNTGTKKARKIRRVGGETESKSEEDASGTGTWQWQADEGWTDYSKAESDQVNVASKSGKTRVKVELRGWEYLFDFKALTQCNTSSGTTRAIRCKAKLGEKRPREDDDDDEDEAPPPKKKAGAAASSSSSASPKPSVGPIKLSADVVRGGSVGDGKWGRHESILHAMRGKGASSIIAFDMDHTMIEPKSGKVHPQGRGDWRWMLPEVVPKLKALHKEGRRIVIFSNQGGINGKGGWDEGKASSVRGKIDDLGDDLGFELSAVLATTEDMWRKPATAMWDWMVKHGNAGVKVDLSQSMYIGDAAGRAAGWKPGRKKDFSCSDRKFASNVGVAFQTPEEYFLNEKPVPFQWDGAVDAGSFKFADQITTDGDTSFHVAGQEIVLFCGFPASGKTTFAERHLVKHGYTHVNRDTLKTPKKCFDTAIAALKAGKSVVVDNTMPKYKSDDKEKCNGRDAYLNLGKKHGCPVRLFHFQTSEELAKHLNMYRERLTEGAHPHVPRIGYNMYKKAYEEPKMSEGYKEIKKIHFVPQFPSDKAKALFNQFA